MSTDPSGVMSISLAARGAYWLALLAVACVVLSPLGHRLGLWDIQLAIPIFGLGVLFAVLAIIFGIVGVVRSNMASVPVGGGSKALISILIAVVTLGVVIAVAVLPAIGKPVIHDVASSPEDAPEFVALAEVHYAGREYKSYIEYNRMTEGMVSGAYPDIRALLHDKSVEEVFAAAELVAAEMGWEIAEVSIADGRIEATDTTALFGYKDDVVIRVRQSPNGQTELDIRSASRVGEGDLGKNASRISEYLAMLQDKLS